MFVNQISKKANLLKNLVVLVIIIIIGYQKMIPLLNLNNYSIKISKNIFINNNFFNNIPYSEQSNELDNHFLWLGTIQGFWFNNIEESRLSFQRLIQSSYLHTKFIFHIANDDLQLARFAENYYPEDPIVLHWIVKNIELDDPINAEKLYKKIIMIDPKNEYAWLRLGMLYDRTSRPSDALKIYMYSCDNNFIRNNTCYYAGMILLKNDEIDLSITYLQKSSWQISLDKAKELLDLSKE
jgi:hypothetical protein